MSNKPKSSKTNITKISARPANAQASDSKKDTAKKTDHRQSISQSEAKVTQRIKVDKPSKLSKKSSRRTSEEKPIKSVFILARPFVAFGRYLRDSWHELRQVRWPNRKMTWKMTLAVLIYCAIFIVFITLLDVFFPFIFDLLINAK